jgi:hypothetical protein
MVERLVGILQDFVIFYAVLGEGRRAQRNRGFQRVCFLFVTGENRGFNPVLQPGDHSHNPSCF